MSKKIFFSLAASLLFMGVGCVAPAKIQKIINSAVAPETAQTPVATGTTPLASVIVDSGIVRWQKPEKIASLNLFVTVTSSQAYEAGGWWYAETPGEKNQIIEVAVDYYRVGNFDYQGQPSAVIMVRAGQAFPGGYFNRYFFVKNSQGATLLASASDKLEDKVTNGIGQEGLVRSLFTIDTTTVLSDLVLPSELHGTLPRQKVVLKETFDSVNFPSESTSLQPGFTDPTYGEIRQDTYRRGFILMKAGPLVGLYALEPDFFDKDGLVPQITWTSGATNNAEYTYVTFGGCGSSNYLKVIDAKDVNVAADLIVVGKNNQNDPIYELKDKSSQRLKDVYENFPTEPKLTYEQFLAARPLLYWVDPFGRLVEMQNIKFQPQAECGKPVIYLYPKKTMNVSVNVKPQGGLTYSEPALNDGWEVEAKPNGDLTEIKTGRYYPYLFWEGRGDIYEQPKQGWVVKRSSVKQFLISKLSVLGLKRSETNDFLEFWLPKMQEKPYYFVTFLGNATMDKLAPLTVSPKPDTIIRILMDFTPLDKPIVAKGFTIRTPKRTGFTVVEWGGVVR